ncbi:hypothetical protein CK503_04995 [Aliifodinibius salipaludis]|uniref:Aromatic hydrocarbon degradation protein n=1 Tax=Fodinibius salipaludis TaxID=2032627 RepID=A0A2A2GB95_9BACT|nr:hypothetical protein [Aliifodinibius salipaludis]PAU94831.1 hypothetical protein CK503_04995 [Aliifodinibius salipaludis]
MKKLALIVTLLVFGTSAAFAQSGDAKAASGSVYSKIGIGYPLATSNSAAQSMGLLGVSFNDTFVGSISNPAHWGNTVYGIGVGEVGVDSYTASDATGSVTNSNFSVGQFQLQLPIIRGELGVSGSFIPVTEAKFRTFEQKTLGVGGEPLDYSVENRGSGGLNRAELGLGWRINSNISVGYATSLYFLSMDDSYVAQFPQSPFRDANFAIETSGHSFGHRVGTSIRLPNILREDDQLGIGATVDLPVELNAERKQTGVIDNGAVNLTKDLQNAEGPIKLPMKISGGVSYRPSNLLMVGLEGLYEGWSGYENDFKPSEDELFVDRYKMGLGIQYFPYVTGSNKFLSSFKYRAGASYDTGHLDIDGQRINTLKFAFGIGIRSPRSNSSIDLSFEYGIRGAQTSNLVKENIWGVRLTLNLAEVMFFRPKLQ